MLVTQIQLKNFMSYDTLDLELPTRGVVLVTGVNGAGKSSLQEAVSVAFWGKTLRKTPAWRKDTEGSVIVTSPGVTATRKCTKKGNSSLSFQVGKQSFDKRKYNTATKAQAALDAVVMPWDLWRRTHVFSPTMAAHFTTAKDSERKRLIESFLGLEMFDRALVFCRADLKTARDELSSAMQRISILDGKASVCTAQHADAKRAVETAEQILSQDEEQDSDVPTAESIKALSDELEEVKEALKDSKADLQGIAGRFPELTRSLTDAETRFRVAQERTGDLASAKCPTCGQDIPKETRERVVEALQGLKSTVEKIRKTVETERRMLEGERTDLNEEITLLQDRVTTLAGELRVAEDRRKTASSEAARERRESAEQNLRDAKSRLARLEELAGKIQAERNKAVAGQNDAKSRVEFLEVVERVLGLRGVRVQVLGKALDGINDLASYWLAQITNNPDASLELKPYSETKTAGVNDALSIVVSGFGGGYGYFAASSGERRRIDVPITMSLATVADAALGVSQGTLWMDEIFDNLDDCGVEAVSGALDELGQERPVVVISHSRKMVERLKPVLHIHVDDGKIITKS